MKLSIKTLLIAVFVLGALVGGVLYTNPNLLEGADFPQQSARSESYASTTAYSLTWGTTATRIVATSTRADATTTLPETYGRTSLTLQPINCSSGSVYVQFNDVAAATSTGLWINASSTETFGDNVPMITGSIRAMAASGNCTLLVTETRSIR